MREALVAVRLIVVIAAGIITALSTGNPAYLLISVIGFGVVALWVWREGYVYEPKWEPLVSQGLDQGNQDDWPQALMSFAAAMKKCRNPRERRQASDQIGTYLYSHDRIGDAEPYLRQAVNLSNAALGPTHPKTGALRNQLSDLYLKSGQAGLAAQLQGRAVAQVVARQSTTLGAADASARYAEVLQQAGDPAAAAAQYARAMQIIDAAKTDNPVLIPVLLSASRYAIKTNDLQRAEDLMRRAGRCLTTESTGKVVDEVFTTLIEVLTAQARYADAVEVAQKRLSWRSLDAPEAAQARRQMADLMEKAGMADEASKQRRVATTLEGMTARR